MPEPFLVLVRVPSTAGATLGALLRHRYGEAFLRIGMGSVLVSGRILDRLQLLCLEDDRLASSHELLALRAGNGSVYAFGAM